MQTTTTTKNDPIALAAVVALLGLALFANLAHIGPPEAQAQNIIILQATPTPSLPTAIPPAPVMIELAQPTPAPIVQDAPPADPPAAPVAIEQAIPPTPDYAAIQATEDARALQSAVDQAVQAINDPQQNGGNVAPQGCPFPIMNGVCANGVLAKSVGESAFGSKSIAGDSGPAHQSKVSP